MYSAQDLLPGAPSERYRAFVPWQVSVNALEGLSNTIYLEEAYYFLPVSLALQFQNTGQYVEALDWFLVVLDYRSEVAHRHLLGLPDDTQAGGYARPSDWLLDPLNPHAIARVRAGTYWRFTVLAIVRCLRDYADAEYTADNAESVPRARVLYMTALRLLDA